MCSFRESLRCCRILCQGEPLDSLWMLCLSIPRVHSMPGTDPVLEQGSTVTECSRNGVGWSVMKHWTCARDRDKLHRREIRDPESEFYMRAKVIV